MLEIEAWFQMTNNTKWPMRIQWSRDRLRRVSPKGQTRAPIRLLFQAWEFLKTAPECTRIRHFQTEKSTRKLCYRKDDRAMRAIGL